MADDNSATPLRHEPVLPYDPDLDTATIALHQASALLDVLATFVDETGATIPETCTESLGQTLYLAKSEVDRALAALSGSKPGREAQS